mmetsp:Transcript_65915/g.190988  ORF Transcript_65915/g.190988 Transcript_65915/m.190988 type:complete len:350 (+) Transcript_65915:824-1873(+)
MRARSATVAAPVAASSLQRCKRASRLCQEVSSSLAKRAMWFSRSTISSRTALRSSSWRWVMSSCIVRCVAANALSAEATLARSRSVPASSSVRRNWWAMSAEAPSSNLASRRLAASMCQFHCSSFRACSALTSCRTAWYWRSISARSCARRLRSDSTPAVTASSWALSWWLTTSRADLSAHTACSSLSIFVSISLKPTSRSFDSRDTASSMRSLRMARSARAWSIAIWQSPRTLWIVGEMELTCSARAAIWSTMTCHWNCANSSFFVSTSDFFCSISRSASTVIVAWSGCRPSRSAAERSWSPLIGRPATSWNWREEWLLILSCVAKCRPKSDKLPTASGGIFTKRPQT